jgi:hypothetical protein
MIYIKMLWFFFTNPRYIWGVYGRLIDFLIYRGKRKELSFKSVEWCHRHAVTNELAIFQLFNKKPDFSFNKKYHKELMTASKAVQESSVKLGGAANLHLLYCCVFYSKPGCIIETGVAYGWSSLAVLLSIKGEGKLISVDMPYTWVKNSKDYVGIVVPDYLKKNWKLIREADRIGLPCAFRDCNTPSLVHYDSDKTVLGRRWAYNYIWKKIDSGCILISDDIGDNLEFKNFCKKIDRVPVIVEDGGKYVGIVRK